MSLKEDVCKNFGQDIILSASAIVDKPCIVIPVSPAIDIILNGGIPSKSLFFNLPSMFR